MKGASRAVVRHLRTVRGRFVAVFVAALVTLTPMPAAGETVIGGIDLGVEGATTSVFASPGDTVTYTFVATNFGEAGAREGRLTIDVASGLDVLSVVAPDAACSVTGDRVDCPIPLWLPITFFGPRPPGSSRAVQSVTITARIAETARGPLSTTARVENLDSSPGTPRDEIPLNDTATVQTTVVATPRLSVAATPAAQRISVGGRAVFELTVSNAGNVDLEGVVVSASAVPGCQRSFAALRIGASESYSCALEGVTGDFENPVVATAIGDGITVTDSTSTTVSVATTDIDLETTIVVDPARVDIGDTVVATVTVNNRGPSTATGIEIRITRPPGLGATTTIGPGATGRWVISRLGPSAEATIDLAYRARTAGTHAVAVEVTAVDQVDRDSTPGDGTGDDQDRASVTVSPATGEPPVTPPPTVPPAGFGSVTGVVWQDRDGDGRRDSGEGIGSGSITLTGGPVSLTTVPSGTGVFGFPNLAPGTYTLTFTGGADGTRALGSATRTVTVTPGGIITGVDFQVEQSGVTTPLDIDVSLNRRSVRRATNTTNPQNDEFAIATVRVSNLGERAANDVTVQITGQGLSIVRTRTETGDFARGVWNVGTVPAFSTATLRLRATSSNAGSFRITATLNAGAAADIRSGQTTLDVVGAEVGIDGSVYVDRNGNGSRDPDEGPPQDPSVFLVAIDYRARDLIQETNSRNRPHATSAFLAQTSGLECRPNADGCRPDLNTGRFVVRNVGQGAYFVTLASSDGVPLRDLLTSPQPQVHILGPEQPLATADFGLRFDPTGNPDPVTDGDQLIAGLVWNDESANGRVDGTEEGVPGVEIRLRDRNVGNGEARTRITRHDGRFEFTVGPGEYEVSIANPGLLLSTSDTYTVFLDDDEWFLNADFGITGQVASQGVIRGTVWDDSDGDAIRDAGEPGIDGIEMVLFGPGRVVTSQTDGTGRFGFTGLAPGRYTVSVSSDVEATSRSSVSVGLDPGAIVDIDFGLRGFVPGGGGGGDGGGGGAADGTGDGAQADATDPREPSTNRESFTWVVTIGAGAGLGGLLLLALWFRRRREPTATAPEAAVPYVGLRSYTADDADRFFGRDDEIRDLVALTETHKIVVLHGPTGIGKTSLLEAGYLPALDAAGYSVLPVAAIPADPGDPDEDRHEPGSSVFVAHLLAGVGAGSDERTLSEHMARRGDEPGRATDQVVVLDRAEEMFAGYQAREGDRLELFRQLDRTLTQHASSRLVIVADDSHLDELDAYLGLLGTHSRADFQVPPLQPEAATEVLTRSLEGTGVSYGKGAAEEIVSRMQRSSETHQGHRIDVETEGVDPMRLQVEASATWRNLGRFDTEVSSEDHIGWDNLGAGLEDYYDQAVTEAGKEYDEGHVRQFIEERMITPQGRPAQVTPEAGMPKKALDLLVKLGIVKDPTAMGFYELIHDRLIEPLKARNEKARESQRVDISSSLLAQAAENWERHGRDHESLLSDDALTDALAWAQEHPDQVSNLERLYLDASSRAAVTGSR